MKDARNLPLIVETLAKPEDVNPLWNGISRHSGQATGVCEGELLVSLCGGATRRWSAGAYGWTWGGACYIRYLFVPKEMRGLGLGTRIMGEIER